MKVMKLCGIFEEGWSTPTYCARMVTNDGHQFELQVTDAAIPKIRDMELLVAYDLVVPGSCVKAYTAVEKSLGAG